MYAVLRHITEGLVVKSLANACEINQLLRKAGNGYEILAACPSLGAAGEKRRELRKKLAPKKEPAAPSAYGFCPTCGAPGVNCERSPNGNTTCANGHSYPHAGRVMEPEGGTNAVTG